MSFKSAMASIENNMVNKPIFDKDGIYLILSGTDYNFEVRADLKFKGALVDFYAAFLCNSFHGFMEAYNRQVDLFSKTLFIFDDDVANNGEMKDAYNDGEAAEVKALLKDAINGATGYHVAWDEVSEELLDKIANNYDIACFICRQFDHINQMIEVKDGKATLVYGWNYSN